MDNRSKTIDPFKLTPDQKVAKAKAGIIMDAPFFGSLLLRLKTVVDHTCPTAWTDGVTMGFNPDFVDSMSLAETKGVMVHEVLHCANLHQFRRGERDPEQYNIACDLAINPIIRKSGFTLPPNEHIDFLQPLFPDGESVEEIYAKIPKGQDGNGKSSGDGGKDGDNSSGGTQGEGGGSAPSGDDKDKNDDKKPDSQDNQEQGDSSQDKPDDKSDSGKGQNDKGDEQDQEKEDKNTDPGGAGEVRDAPSGEGDGPAQHAEREIMEQDWKNAVAQAAVTAKMMGDMPGGMERIVDGILEPQVDWKGALRDFVDRTVKRDYSWMKPNRRFIQNGIMLPSLESTELGNIVIGVDTSCSIDDDDLAQYASELTDILSIYDVDLTVLYCDTRVQHVDEFSRADLPIHMEIHGGGGTRFSPVFKKVKELDLNPLALVYFTDLCCSDFGETPEYPTLWINNYKYSNDKVVPFGDVINVEQNLHA